MATNSTQNAFSILTHPAVFTLRTLFYAVAPAESAYEDYHQVPDYVSKVSPFFFSLITLEVIVLYLKGMKKRLPRLNDAISSLSAGVIAQLPLFLMRNIEMSMYVWVHEHWKLYTLHWDSPFTWGICMLGVDLGYYWVHRCAHEVNFMWAGHQTHHSSQHYNLTTALRQGIFQKYSSWIFYLPLALFIPPAIFMVHIQFNLLYQFWIHTEAIDQLGPLEYILNTPSHHRVHHGVNRYCIDKNYAGVLIIWDRIFGTFEAERREDEVVYGLTHQLNSWNPIYTQTNHWLYLLSTLWKTVNNDNKLGLMLKGPGWQPGKPRLGLSEDIPDAHAPAVYYNSTVKKSLLNLYTVSQFLLVIVLYETIIKYQQSINVTNMLLCVLFILWTLTNIGFFYDQKPHAAWSELIRCMVIVVVDWYILKTSHIMFPIVIPALRYAAFIGLPVCITLVVKDIRLTGVHESKEKIN